MPTIASTMPSRRLSPMQVSRKRPRLWPMSFSARFTSRPAAGARGTAFAQIGAVVDDDRSWQFGGYLHAPVQQPLADLHAAPGEPAVLQDPHRTGTSIIAIDELQRHEEPVRNHFLDDLDLGLFAEEAQLMLRTARLAPDVNAALFGEAVVLLIDPDD